MGSLLRDICTVIGAFILIIFVVAFIGAMLPK